MADTKNEFISYLENVMLLVIGVVLLAFPLVFTSLTTDAFTLPKQILLASGVVLSIVLFGVKMIAEGRVKVRTSPFDIPVLVMMLVVLVSALFANNRYDALIAAVPFLFAGFFYFIIVNVVKKEKSLLFVLATLTLGAVLSSLLTILSFFKIYPLPLAYTHTQAFTPMGSLLDQAIYLALVLPVAGYFVYTLIVGLNNRRQHAVPFEEGKKEVVKPDLRNVGFSVAAVIIALGLVTTVYMLATTQKPLILPFETGFQTAFASISQDTGHVFKSFLLGSGFGTYVTDFTRFKSAAFNNNATLWSFTFFQSSSFVLELLATTGLLGLLAFLFIIYRVVRERHFFVPLILAIIAAFILPFTFTLQALLFILLGLFAVTRAQTHARRYAEQEFYLVALKRGLIAPGPDGEAQRTYSKFLPIIFSLLMIVVIGVMTYFAVKFVVSDVTFQSSLVAQSQNNAQATYKLETQAISQFPWRDAYYRIFSQTNLRIANSLAAAQPQGASPSAQVQNNIVTLIQQAITAGRSAVTVSPQSASNWNNLSSIYRALIGFGQNADQFAVITNQQAIALDPNNPQQYISLGGIYYQIQQWDEASRQFQLAVQLKPDYANAYYNLGHALESKGDSQSLEQALSMYQTVKQLVSGNKASVKQINIEIKALQDKIGQQKNGQQANTNTPTGEAQNQAPLDVNQSGTQLPERNPKVNIPSPAVTLTPTPAKSQNQNQTEGGTPLPSVSPTK